MDDVTFTELFNALFNDLLLAPLYLILLFIIMILAFGTMRVKAMINEGDIDKARSFFRNLSIICTSIILCVGIIYIIFDYKWIGIGLFVVGLLFIIHIKYPDYHIANTNITRHDYFKWRAKELRQRISIQKSLVTLNSQDYLDMVFSRLESEGFEIFQNTNNPDYPVQYTAIGKRRIPELSLFKRKVFFVFSTFPSITVPSLNEFSSQAVQYSKMAFSKPSFCIPVAIVDDVDPSLCEQVRRIGISSFTTLINMPVVCIPSANELVFSESNPYLLQTIIYSLRELITYILEPCIWDSDNVELVQAEA